MASEVAVWWRARSRVCGRRRAGAAIRAGAYETVACVETEGDEGVDACGQADASVRSGCGRGRGVEQDGGDTWGGLAVVWARAVRGVERREASGAQTQSLRAQAILGWRCQVQLAAR